MSATATAPVGGHVVAGRLPAPARALVHLGLRAVTRAYRLRYGRRLVVGEDVIIFGGLKLQQGTTLHLGDRVRVRRGVIVNGGGEVHVGADTLLNGCWIGATTRVDVGRRCLVSDCFVTDSDFHNLDPAERHLPPGPRSRKPVVIEDNVWIGAQAWVLKGSRIGRDSVVSAVSVVRGEVPPAVVVLGNPATVVKHLPPAPEHV
ncbi:hypothetical protein [Nocardioides bruguierae]|uniref:hypothetical protein n=1 Tax=Nocardioides bruguierae TaxID=2945102 RepID=UPI002020005F|nr:hypothetical protein [Nocardioides bruguierae]MCL8027265.1 hypothetical protein [Nocardioides bruguierae]